MSEKHMKPMSLDEIRQLKGKTDWDRLVRAGDFEGRDEEEFDLDWSTTRVVMPEPKKAVSLRIDPDILDFFKSQGKGYQTRMNAVLRAYMEAKRAG